MKTYTANYEVHHLQVCATPGTELHTFLMSALALAAQESVTVIAIHNKRNYYIVPKDLVKLIIAANEGA